MNDKKYNKNVRNRQTDRNMKGSKADRSFNVKAGTKVKHHLRKKKYKKREKMLLDNCMYDNRICQMTVIEMVNKIEDARKLKQITNQSIKCSRNTLLNTYRNTANNIKKIDS